MLSVGLQIPSTCRPAKVAIFSAHPKDYHGIPRHKPFLPEPSDAGGWASRAFRAAQSSEKALQQVPAPWGSLDVWWCLATPEFSVFFWGGSATTRDFLVIQEKEVKGFMVEFRRSRFIFLCDVNVASVFFCFGGDSFQRRNQPRAFNEIDDDKISSKLQTIWSSHSLRQIHPSCWMKFRL